MNKTIKRRNVGMAKQLDNTSKEEILDAGKAGQDKSDKLKSNKEKKFNSDNKSGRKGKRSNKFGGHNRRVNDPS